MLVGSVLGGVVAQEKHLRRPDEVALFDRITKEYVATALRRMDPGSRCPRSVDHPGDLR